MADLKKRKASFSYILQFQDISRSVQLIVIAQGRKLRSRIEARDICVLITIMAVIIFFFCLHKMLDIDFALHAAYDSKSYVRSASHLQGSVFDSVPKPSTLVRDIVIEFGRDSDTNIMSCAKTLDHAYFICESMYGFLHEKGSATCTYDDWVAMVDMINDTYITLDGFEGNVFKSCFTGYPSDQELYRRMLSEARSRMDDLLYCAELGRSSHFFAIRGKNIDIDIDL